MEKPKETAVEEDDALSLSDLPLLHHTNDDSDSATGGADQSKSKPRDSDDFDFDFGFRLGLREAQMCTADELFFQGRILPFRHSFSVNDKFQSRPISRCYSLERSTKTTALRPPARVRNQFVSYPSPSPKIRESIRRNCNQPQKPSPWSIFRLGLVTPPPGLTFQELKLRNRNGNFGSRNSTSSRGSSVCSGKTKKVRAAFLPGCRYCSIDAVDTLASTSRVVIFRRECDGGERESPAMAKKAAVAKKQITRQRTFEWIKQLQ